MGSNKDYNNNISGCHVVAPSDMNDGRIGMIKQKLCENYLETKVGYIEQFWKTPIPLPHIGQNRPYGLL